MYIYYNHPNGNLENISVCGVPFKIERKNAVIASLINGNYMELQFEGSCEAVYFLGMCTESWQCSEWWGQQEPNYDHSTRLFFGDRVGRIRIIYENRTEDMIPLLFGVNVWNYNLYFKSKPHEGNMMSFSAPYDEPFRSDANAAKLLDDCLKLTENTADNAEKGSKFVLGFKISPEKKIKKIIFHKDDGKRAGFCVSAVTGVTELSALACKDKLTDLSYYLRKDYFAATDRLARRIYQFKDELPEHDPLVEIKNYDGPDINFGGCNIAEIYTNVYRRNLTDMAYGKITDDGMPHTSSAGTANFGCYIGFGTYNVGDSYGAHVWTRDIGRTLTELVNNGYFSRTVSAADQLHKMLYNPSVWFHIPHWKRVANLIAQNENDIFNEGNENDGHASVMLFMYSLYNKGAVDKTWLYDHKKELKDASDYYLWQKDHPAESGYNGMLYSNSEASTQTNGGYDLFSNVISALALKSYAVLFDVMEDQNYAAELRSLAEGLKCEYNCRFMMSHPRLGKVYTDTTDDCWTYEYKRFAELFLQSDVAGYDIYRDAPELFEVMSRTFEAERELYYNPASGRQMGYGQGYLTLTVLSLDLFDELTDCMEAAAMFSYHHTDFKYIVPEGVIMHGDCLYWYRNSDLGNAVQQAEIVKCARLVVGIDDIDKTRGLRLIPRMPLTWNLIDVKDYPVTGMNFNSGKISYTYRRMKTPELPAGAAITAHDSETAYTMEYNSTVKVETIRFGPFNTPDIRVNGADSKKDIVKIQGRYFVYI